MTTLPTNPAPITLAGAPVLRQRAAEIAPEEIATPEFRQLVDTMVATMRAAQGVGLAAPQIGVAKRVIVLEDTPEASARLTDAERAERERVPFPLTVFVNPLLRPIGTARTTYFEGCLSIPGYVGLVERVREVEVNGLDARGQVQTWRVAGWPARILQHEIDHLDGVLYTDRMLARSFTAADLAPSLYGGKSMAEVKAMMGAP